MFHFLFFCLFLFSCSKDTIESSPKEVKTLPIAPSNLKATSLSTKEINLTWIDNSTNEDGFKIERKDGTSDFKVVATIGIDKTEYKDSMLNPYVQYFYRLYSFNSSGKSLTYSNTDSAATNGVPSVTTKPIDSIASTDALSGVIINNNGGFPIEQSGIVWSISNTPSLELANITRDYKGSNNFKSVLIGLSPGTTYYVWGYATNKIGTSFGNMLVFKTKDFVFQEYISSTGRIWMDRNLGAGQVATNIYDQKSFGDLFQWGRNSDGHQVKTSITSNILSTNDNPGHSFFIIGSKDWLINYNNTLWQGKEAKNNACPTGYSIPTLAEWQEEIKSWNFPNYETEYKFNSNLKLPMAGYRGHLKGEYFGVSSFGYYATSTPNNPETVYIINLSPATSSSYGKIILVSERFALRAEGLSIRCIKNK